MFEHRHEDLAPFPVFLKRVVGSFGLSIGLISGALLAGIAGYHWIGGLDYIDALLEASMILGGMGPINVPVTTGAKLFASAYALFSGLMFIAVMGILLTPVVHRMLHKFHLGK